MVWWMEMYFKSKQLEVKEEEEIEIKTEKIKIGFIF